MLVLAVVQVVFAGFTGLVGLFADGGGLWERLLVSLVHPLGAVALLLVVLGRSSTTVIRATLALLAVNVVADLAVALMIARGAMQGDWWLAAAFAVVPAIGVVYVGMLLKTDRAAAA